MFVAIGRVKRGLRTTKQSILLPLPSVALRHLPSPASGGACLAHPQYLPSPASGGACFCLSATPPLASKWQSLFLLICNTFPRERVAEPVFAHPQYLPSPASGGACFCSSAMPPLASEGACFFPYKLHFNNLCEFIPTDSVCINAFCAFGHVEHTVVANVPEHIVADFEKLFGRYVRYDII